MREGHRGRHAATERQQFRSDPPWNRQCRCCSVWLDFQRGQPDLQPGELQPGRTKPLPDSHELCADICRRLSSYRAAGRGADGDAHFGLAQRGRIVDAVARHAGHVPRGLQILHHDALVLRIHFGETIGAR